MNTLEDRLRDALRERADHSPVSSDAWERVLARARRRRAFVLGGHAWQARYVIPALAAAAVAGIIIAANLVAGQLPSGPASAPAGGATYAPAASSPPGPAQRLAATGRLSREVPASSAVLSYEYSPEGKQIWASFWLGHRSPAVWFDNISPGLQLCSAIIGTYTTQQPQYGTTGPERPVLSASGQAFCRPVPQLAAGQVVRVTGGINAGEPGGAFAAMSMRSGVAAAAVVSVTAVLPDGRTFAGVVGTGRGFSFKVWSVTYPPDGAVRLVFRDGSGRELASLTRPAVPSGLVQRPAARPGRGGVGLAGGAVTAYLIGGHVGFWIAPSGWAAYAPPPAYALIAPSPAAGGPALAGILVASGQAGAGPAQDPFRQVSEFIGYADAGVAKVVLRVRGGYGVTQLTVAPRPAGWSGTGVRLWAVAAPARTYLDTSQDTVTAYNAAGQVIAVVPLGSPAAPG